MTSIGNLQFQLDQMAGTQAANTTVKVIYKSEDGIVLGISTATAVATLTALDTSAFPFSHGCLIICVNTVSANSVRLVWNAGTVSAPSFVGLVT